MALKEEDVGRKPQGIGLAVEAWGSCKNSLGPSDLGEALDLTVVHLWEICLPRPCAPPGLVRPSGLDTRG
uniref:Uncharacterized protein n=1 Tax=Salix viminalis TaxID=40686 RepID=A0A6N2LWP5_SALVM